MTRSHAASLVVVALAVALSGCASSPSPPDPAPATAAFREVEAALSEPPRAQTTPAPSPPPPRPSPHGSFSEFLQTHFSSDAWRDDVVRDYLTARPVLLPAGLAVAALAVSPWDDDLERSFESSLGDNPQIATITLSVLLAGSLADGLIAPAPGRTATDETFAQVEALALTEGLTEILKATTNRRRPGDSNSSASFPSSHASAAFAAATLLERNAGPELGIPAYGLAALTAFSRVEAGRHFPSDVLAGAALGSLCAGAIDALHFGTGREGKGIAGSTVAFEVGPSEQQGLELALNIRF